MSNRLLLLGVVFAISFQAAIASDDSLLEEYVKRETAIRKMNSTYDEYRATYPQHKEERQRILKRFMDLFQETFDSSDEWLLTNLVSDDGIAEELTEAIGFDYGESKAALESASKLYVDASLQRIRYEIHSGNFSEAERLEDAIDAETQKLQVKINATMDYIRTTAYKAQFKLDAQSFARKYAQILFLPDLLVARLNKKFPFRSWVAVLLDPRKEAEFCPNGGDVFTTRAGSRRLMVFDVSNSESSNTKLARQLLSRVENSRSAWVHPCENRAKDILYKEANYKCSSKAFRVAGVVEMSKVLPRIIASKPSLMNSKEVYRARLTFWCKANFKVLFLA